MPADTLVAQLGSHEDGLSEGEAGVRLKRDGANALEAAKSATAAWLFVNQFKSPLVLILILASIISMLASEWIDAGVVLAIVFGSTVLGFVQEYIAGNAIERLRSKVTIHSSVLRRGHAQTVASSKMVQGLSLIHI